MQLLCHITDFCNESAFDAHMDIFIIHVEYDFAGFDFGFDCLKACDNLFCLFLGYDALFSQHGYMCNAALNIFFIHFLIKKR